ncbi:MAG: hypothetical protein J6W09_09780 [Bacteroidales bacterium]|nr:hypothetical protein [Bacteroidales bacterium]
MEKNVTHTPAKSRNKWEMESLFSSNGPFYHVCSKALENALLFYGVEDKKAALAYLAITGGELNARLLAYSLMSNHFHLLLNCPNPQLYYSMFVEKLESYLSRHGHPGIKLPKEPTVVPIKTLKQFRETLAYIIRNEYVVNPNVSPVNNLWCSGYLYFNELLLSLTAEMKKVSAKELGPGQQRRITKSRDMKLPSSAVIWKDFVLPSSFVDFKLAESLFQDARQFTVSVFKNVEAQVETALSVGETPITPDEELSGIVFSYCKRTWNKKPLELTRPEVIELMRHLKLTYYSSNAQVARLTGMPIKDVDTFFPLSAKLK